MVTEDQFLMKYDELKEQLSHICVLPERTANLLLVFIHRCGGALLPQYRKQFPNLADAEIAGAEQAYREVHRLS